jgi:UDP-N-acetylglucosamine 4-epimerase
VEKVDMLEQEIAGRKRTWLVTGCAGFIGSHLLEHLLALEQDVIGLDNFATGSRRNLDDVRGSLGAAQWARFSFLRADIRDASACREAVRGVDVVLHQAALGSVPRSLADPLASHDVNVNGFLNMLIAARDAGTPSFVYAASSSAYGDHPALPKREEITGKPLSPYALTKRIDEMYADVFARCYGYGSIGLRYFNVFGKRQDPNGAYAAVIPRWLNAMIAGEAPAINGDGSNSRDFCHVDNVVQANLRAALAGGDTGRIYNIGLGDITTLGELCLMLGQALSEEGIATPAPLHAPPRAGDVAHSQADIGRAVAELGYAPRCRIRQGIKRTVPWYIRQHALARR